MSDIALIDMRGVMAGLFAAGLICPSSAWSADGDSGITGIVVDNVASAGTRQAGQMAITPEVSTIRTRNAPLAAAPVGLDGRPMSDLAGVNYKLWMSRGRADVGVGVGTMGYVAPRPDGRVDGPVTLSAATPTLSVGLRYRVNTDSSVYADATHARGLGVDVDAAYVNTKVGMEWQPAKKTFGFDHGAIGVHFDSGYHLSVKARRGGLGVYLRGQF